MTNNSDILPEEFEMIENYLQQNMSAADVSAFENQLQKDSLLQEKVLVVKSIISGIKQAAQAIKISEWHNKLEENQINSTVALNHKASTITLINKWSIAATIMVCVVAVWVIVFSKSKEEQLFSKYYKPDFGLVIPMSSTDNYAFNKSMIDYKTGKYQLAINEWKQALVNQQGNDTLYYFIGSSYLALGNFKDAAINFDRVLSIPKSTFEGDAYWYLGLAQLKLNQSKEAAANISKSTHSKKAALLKELSH